MPEHPLVSVVMSVHNDAGRVERAVRSILGQDYENFELVVVDDGSSDQSGAILDAILATVAWTRAVTTGGMPPVSAARSGWKSVAR